LSARQGRLFASWSGAGKRHAASAISGMSPSISSRASVIATIRLLSLDCLEPRPRHAPRVVDLATIRDSPVSMTA
jgi:hypothetical protein